MQYRRQIGMGVVLVVAMLGMTQAAWAGGEFLSLVESEEGGGGHPRMARRSPMCVDDPNARERPRAVGALARIQEVARPMLQPGTSEVWGFGGRLSPEDLTNSFFTVGPEGISGFNVLDAEGFEERYKCNLFAFELAYRAGLRIPIGGRGRGWGYLGPVEIIRRIDTGRLDTRWAIAVDELDIEQLQEATAQGVPFMLVGQGHDDRAGHMGMVHEIHRVNYDDDGSILRVEYSGWEANGRGAFYRRRVWGHVRFASIHILELQEPNGSEPQSFAVGTNPIHPSDLDAERFAQRSRSDAAAGVIPRRLAMAAAARSAGEDAAVEAALIEFDLVDAAYAGDESAEEQLAPEGSVFDEFFNTGSDDALAELFTLPELPALARHSSSQISFAGMDDEHLIDGIGGATRAAGVTAESSDPAAFPAVDESSFLAPTLAATLPGLVEVAAIDEQIVDGVRPPETQVTWAVDESSFLAPSLAATLPHLTSVGLDGADEQLIDGELPAWDVDADRFLAPSLGAMPRHAGVQLGFSASDEIVVEGECPAAGVTVRSEDADLFLAPSLAGLPRQAGLQLSVSDEHLIEGLGADAAGTTVAEADDVDLAVSEDLFLAPSLSSLDRHAGLQVGFSADEAQVVDGVFRWDALPDQAELLAPSLSSLTDVAGVSIGFGTDDEHLIDGHRPPTPAAGVTAESWDFTAVADESADELLAPDFLGQPDAQQGFTGDDELVVQGEPQVTWDLAGPDEASFSAPNLFRVLPEHVSVEISYPVDGHLIEGSRSAAPCAIASGLTVETGLEELTQPSSDSCEFDVTCADVPNPGLVSFFVEPIHAEIPRVLDHSEGWDWLVECGGPGVQVGRVRIHGSDCDHLRSGRFESVEAEYGFPPEIQ